MFPRAAVWIEHEGGRPFIADPTVVTFYNRRQPYRRRALAAEGDRCDWYAFDPAVVVDVMGRIDPAVEDRPERPFRFAHGPVDAVSYAEQRAVAHHLARAEAPDAVAVEETMLRVLARVARLAAVRHGLETARPAPSPHACDAVARVRAHVLDHLGDRLTLSRLAAVAGCSPFQLCRAFSRVTGGRLHAWLLRLRVQVALERTAEPGRDLTAVALDLGFASHSHFTAAFRRAFGLTPSEWRRRARTGDLRRLAAAP